MFKKIAIATVLVAAAAGAAHAGYKGGNYTVAYGTEGSYKTVAGALGNIRNSSDSLEYITCYVYNFPDGTEGTCSAKDANGTAMTCTIPNGIYTSALSLGTDSYIKIIYDTSGNCQEIDTAVGSYFAPKTL